MPPEAQFDSQRFRDCLERDLERVVFVEDSNRITADSLRTAVHLLAARMRESGVRRFAVYSNKPSVLATCLLASTEAESELLLLRSPHDSNHSLLNAAHVNGVIEENLEVRRIVNLDEPPPAGAGVLISTSGTSGTPKIVRHSLATLMGRIRPAVSKKKSVRWLLTYQPYGFAGIQIILTVLATDSTMVCLSEMNVPCLAWAAVDHAVTHISGTPTFWRAFVLSLTATGARPDLEQITLGGEIVDQATLDLLRVTFPNARCAHIYASTEAGALFSVQDGQAGFPSRWLHEPVDDVRLRIREGVLEVRSPRQMLSYTNGDHANHTHDGWLITGDRVEERGDRVYFCGREDSLINVGGAKVTPEEVESALLGIRGVFDLRAFAVPNPITGFVVGLEVVAMPESDHEKLKEKILTTAREKLAAYKVPRLIRFVSAVRTDPSGKKSRKAD
jgi:acyl-coenzyme A synthetase/AMP-(fatty) acid ligase